MAKRKPRCPVCGDGTANGFREGEWVDVGVGSIQATPDLCECCGYEQVGCYADDAIHAARCEAFDLCFFHWTMNRTAPAGAD